MNDTNPINTDLDDLLNEHFAGKVVRKDLTKLVKEGANVPVYVLLRSCGYEPTHFEPRVKMHLLCRMVPLVENNYNVCELGPRGTGKSHIYKEMK